MYANGWLTQSGESVCQSSLTVIKYLRQSVEKEERLFWCSFVSHGLLGL